MSGIPSKRPLAVTLSAFRSLFAVAAASQPNAVTDELMARLKQHWSDEQIVEFAGAVSLNGFLNRWNDTIAPALEAEPIEFGEHHLARHGWSVGKHRP